MNNTEFSNEFDVLYNSIVSNQAPGLNAYEKSVFLTKAQDEIVKSYFNPRSNKTQEGFDGNERRQIDFSMIMRSHVYSNITVVARPDLFEASDVALENSDTTPSTDAITLKAYLKIPHSIYDPQVSVAIKPGIVTDYKIEYIPEIDILDKKLQYQAIVDNASKFEASIDRNVFNVSKGQITEGDKTFDTIIASPFTTSFFDLRDETKAVTLDSDILMIVNEYVEVSRNNSSKRLTVVPISYTDYSRLMSKPYKRPLQNQAWRLIDSSGGTNKAELIVGPNDVILKYVVRYVKRPRAIILEHLDDDVSLDGYVGADKDGNPVTERSKAVQGITCELDPILHHEIVQRAVELAKASYGGDLQSQIALGQSSQTNIGAIQASR